MLSLTLSAFDLLHSHPSQPSEETSPQTLRKADDYDNPHPCCSNSFVNRRFVHWELILGYRSLDMSCSVADEAKLNIHGPTSSPRVHKHGCRHLVIFRSLFCSISDRTRHLQTLFWSLFATRCKTLPPVASSPTPNLVTIAKHGLRSPHALISPYLS